VTGVLFGISTPFDVLSPIRGEITHALLTRAPLYSPSEDEFLVRLACVKHAASVHSEPGSNSPIKLKICFLKKRDHETVHYLVFKDQVEYKINYLITFVKNKFGNQKKT
jgi:hypothetical protein